MAKVTIKIKRPTGDTFKGWTFVLVAGLVLTVIAVFDSGRFAPVPVVPPADGSTGCQFRVVVPADVSGARTLNVRAAPDINAPIKGTLRHGVVVDTIGKPTNGFRALEGGGGNNWASADHLTLVSGTDCG